MSRILGPTTALEALVALQLAISFVERIGARSQSGMLADENYPALLVLRDVEGFLERLVERGGGAL